MNIDSSVIRDVALQVIKDNPDGVRQVKLPEMVAERLGIDEVELRKVKNVLWDFYYRNEKLLTKSKKGNLVYLHLAKERIKKAIPSVSAEPLKSNVPIFSMEDTIPHLMEFIKCAKNLNFRDLTKYSKSYEEVQRIFMLKALLEQSENLLDSLSED